jgi:hypothetical protein
VVCTFPESAGEGVIPAAILNYLDPTAAFGTGDSFSVDTSTSKQVTVGDWTITALANRSSQFAVAFIQ